MWMFDCWKYLIDTNIVDKLHLEINICTDKMNTAVE
jgi:hypothetical protein